MKYFLSIILSIFLAAPAWGCEKNVYRLLEGEKAPCTGYLFSPKKELELRLLDTEHKFLKKELEVKDRLIEYYQKNDKISYEIIEKERQKAELWRTTAEKNTLELIKTQDQRGKRDWLFFVGGILCTVAAGYALGQAAK